MPARIVEHIEGPANRPLCNKATVNDTGPVQRKRIYQYGPNCVRESRDFRAALAVLAERGRARMKEDGRRRCVAIEPALLADRDSPSMIGF